MSQINISNRKLNPINRLEIERDEFLKNSLQDDEEETDFNQFRNPNYKSKMQDNNAINQNARIPMRPTYNINQPIYDFERFDCDKEGRIKLFLKVGISLVADISL